MAVIRMGQISNHQTVPWWVNSVYKIGVPTAIACFLVWFLAAKVQTHLEAITTLVTQHAAEQGKAYSNEEKQLHMLRIICTQGAKNVSERNACLE